MELLGFLIDFSALDHLPDQTIRIDRRPLGILGREMPMIPSRVANIEMKNLWIAQSGGHDLSPQRAEQTCQ